MQILLMRVVVAVLALVVVSALPVENGSDEYINTPIGPLLSSCVREVPSGALLEELATGEVRVTADGVSSILPPCRKADAPLFLGAGANPLPSDYDGWEAYTAFKDNSSAGFDAFLGYFSVPDKPEHAASVLYLFTGLQNIDWIPKVDPFPSVDFDIIQPVLQYPCSYFERYWCVKSWYVTLNAGALTSPGERVEPGDKIYGNMTRTGATSWFVGSTVASTGKTVSITADNARLTTQPWAYNTLECYGCSGCGTYPKQPCNFTQLQLIDHDGQTVSPVWLANPKPTKDPQCQENVTIIDPQTVSVYFTTQ